MNQTILEVHVKERINVVPDHFEFHLLVKKYLEQDEQVIQQEQRVIDQIVSRYESSGEKNQTNRNSQDMYILNLDSISEVKKLSAEMVKLKNIKISWASNTSSKEEETESILTEKLLDKAKKRGEKLSELMKRPLGEMIIVVDNPMKDIRNEKWEWVVYPPMAPISQWLSDFSEQKIIFEKEMTVKFQLKD